MDFREPSSARWIPFLIWHETSRGSLALKGNDLGLNFRAIRLLRAAFIELLRGKKGVRSPMAISAPATGMASFATIF
jgi:hypothetical protein